MNKGKAALVGALVGCIAPYFIFCIIEGDFIPLGEAFFMLTLLAILGAIIGSAFGGRGKKNMEEESEEAIKQETQPQNSAVSELLDYKKLLDAGIITQEEFDKKKEELLKEL